jgi:hypothetical protein
MNYVGIDWAYGRAAFCAMGETGAIASEGLIPADGDGRARLGASLPSCFQGPKDCARGLALCMERGGAKPRDGVSTNARSGKAPLAPAGRLKTPLSARHGAEPRLLRIIRSRSARRSAGRSLLAASLRSPAWPLRH